jgi:hypothetical protein
MIGGGIFAGKLLPVELQKVLDRLVEMFGPNLHFISYDDEFVNFQVWGLDDEVLFRELERNQETLFGSELHKLQILRPFGRSNDRGVFLCYLEPEIRHEYQAGFTRY